MLILISIILLKFNFTYSKYSSLNQVKSSTTVAKPIVVFNGAEKKNINSLNLDKYSYNFSVENFNGDLISEVDLKYHIVFELSQKNAPVILNLYRKNGDSEEKVEIENNKTKFEEVMKRENTKNDYRVEVSYDTNSKEIMKENLKINILVQAVQGEVNIE